MYAYLHGTLEEIDGANIVIDVNGVGYNVQISAGKAGLLPQIGEKIKVYTYTSIRENAMELFGFVSRQELALFKKLITVNSVGPKFALNILAALSVEEVIFAILGEDKKTLTKASGVGEKMAAKIILELKTKINKDDYDLRLDHNLDIAQMNISYDSDSVEITETIEVLISFGYSLNEAKNAVNQAVKEMGIASTEELLKGALRHI